MTWSRLRRIAPLTLGLAAGLAAAPTLFRAAVATRLMVAGQRQPLWRLPADLGLQAEDVDFSAADGVPLRGWLIRRAGDDGTPAPAVAFVHGWPWNRLGNRAGLSVIPDRDVDLLGPAAALVRAGFHVLLFDLRNHGESGAAIPVTFGVREARDVAAALALLRARPEVDPARVGLIGYSMGANAALMAAPDIAPPPRAVVAVQPVRATTFAPNSARQVIGPLGPVFVVLGEWLLRLLGAPPFRQIDPTPALWRLRDVSLLFVQGDGDRWGALADVESMVAAAADARPLVVAPSDERFGGYQWVEQHADQLVAFFREALA